MGIWGRHIFPWAYLGKKGHVLDLVFVHYVPVDLLVICDNKTSSIGPVSDPHEVLSQGPVLRLLRLLAMHTPVWVSCPQTPAVACPLAGMDLLYTLRGCDLALTLWVKMSSKGSKTTSL